MPLLTWNGLMKCSINLRSADHSFCFTLGITLASSNEVCYDFKCLKSRQLIQILPRNAKGLRRRTGIFVIIIPKFIFTQWTLPFFNIKIFCKDEIQDSFVKLVDTMWAWRCIVVLSDHLGPRNCY